jgi:hypothetical protein
VATECGGGQKMGVVVDGSGLGEGGNESLSERCWQQQNLECRLAMRRIASPVTGVVAGSGSHTHIVLHVDKYLSKYKILKKKNIPGARDATHREPYYYCACCHFVIVNLNRDGGDMATLVAIVTTGRVAVVDASRNNRDVATKGVDGRLW